MANPQLEDTLCTLLAARTILAQPGGWKKEKFGDTRNLSCAHCAGGALLTVAPSPVREVVGVLGFKGVGDLYVWNDHPKRTKAQVLAAFDKAIAKVEREMDGSKEVRRG